MLFLRSLALITVLLVPLRGNPDANPSALADRLAPPPAARLAVIEGHVRSQLEGLDRELAKTLPQPGSRDLSHAALASLLLGEPPARAQAYLERAFRLQNMDTNAPDYGNLPWQENRPEIRDPNAIQFTFIAASYIFAALPERLDPAFVVRSRPHLIAALAALRRHQPAASYSNIFLMKACSLLQLGIALDDPTATADGRAMLAEWSTLARTYGIREFNSPTYTAVMICTVGLATQAPLAPADRASLAAIADYLWLDLAAHYYAPRGVMAGANSRSYRFLEFENNVNQLYYLAGLREAPPERLLLNDQIRLWAAASLGRYQPPALITEVARRLPRTFTAPFDLGAGRERTTYLTADYSLGTAGAFTSNQSRPLVAILGARDIPIVTLIPDKEDSPYGLFIPSETARDGRRRARILKATLATVQDRDTALLLLDVQPTLGPKDQTATLATNLLFPLTPSAIWLNGQLLFLEPDDAPRSLPPDSILVLREGDTALAARVFLAEDLDQPGQTAPGELKVDGHSIGAARLAFYHRRITNPSLAPAEKLPAYAGLIITMAPAPTDAAALALGNQLRTAQITLARTDATLTATATFADSARPSLSVTLDRAAGGATHRAINGQPYTPPNFALDGLPLPNPLAPAAPAASAP